jgi:phage antirepressor YoqD-like protein
MNIINYSYKGSEISFMGGNNVMINATQMAKPFGKQPVHWLTNQNTKDYLDTLSKLRNLSLDDLVQVMKGGNNPGTWMHEDVALEFARWLNPAFAIWCNDRIKELLRTGVATSSNDDEAIVYAMQVLNKRLEQSRAEKAMLEQQNTYLANEIKGAAPKVKCYDEYISSEGTYTTTQIAKEYGWGAETLNKKLAAMGIQYKQNRQWILYAKHDGKGYTKSKPVTYPKSDGTTGTQMQTVWTSKGREFIHSILRE